MFDQKLTSVAARALLRVRFAGQDEEQMNALAAKARAGTLSPQEQLELDNYERLDCLLDILHSRARLAIR